MSNRYIAENIVLSLRPANGWWKDRTEGTLINVAEQLLDKLLTEHEVEDILSNVIYSIREEYGE